MNLNTTLSNFIKISLVLALYLNSAAIFAQDDELKTAIISLDFNESDEGKTILATLTDEEGNPGEDVELSFFVQRTFSLLPFGGFFNTTDENGQIEVEFPKELPGDKDGFITLYVKVLESDIFVDSSVEFKLKWGIPLHMDEQIEKRSLWAAAANAPISLIVIVSAMIFAVWYIICFILFKLYRISRMKEESILN